MASQLRSLGGTRFEGINIAAALVSLASEVSQEKRSNWFAQLLVSRRIILAAVYLIRALITKFHRDWL